MRDKQIITKSQMIMRIAELSANLVAKVRECERLKKEKRATEEASELFVKNADEIARVLENKLDQLKAENERLEAHSATLDAVIETGRVQYKALKQTLTEIKEIAEDESYIGFWDEQISKIRQKISEVEECKQ